MNILNLSNWEIIDLEENPDDYLVTAKYVPGPNICPMCQRMLPRLKRNGIRPQLFMDLPIHAKRVGIRVSRQRYKCEECGATFIEELPDMHESHRATRRLVEYVQSESLKRTFVSIADDVGIAEATVRAIFRDHAVELEKAHRANVTPRWIGLDEIKLASKYRCVIANVEKRTIVDLLVDRGKKRVTRYLRTLPGHDSVELVAMDMWNPYRDAVYTALPGAVIVIDKFHVVKMANAALDTVRKSVRAGLTLYQRRTLMHDRFILLKRKGEVEADKVLILDVWLGRFPALQSAYKLKEDFFEIWDTAGSSQEAQERYQEWEAGIPDEVAWAFKDLTTAVRNWEAEIFAYFDHRVTNAYTEALNSIMKLTHRIGRGYSFDAIRAKILFNGGLHIERRAPFGTQDFQSVAGIRDKTAVYQPLDEEFVLNYGVMISTIAQQFWDGQL